MSSMWMSDGDIVMMYRQAKSPPQEIKVLAELNGVTRDVIVDVLRRSGVEMLIKGKRSGKKKAPRWTPEQDATLADMLSAGESYTAIAEKIGRSRYAVKTRVYTLGMNQKKYVKGD